MKVIRLFLIVLFIMILNVPLLTAQENNSVVNNDLDNADIEKSTNNNINNNENENEFFEPVIKWGFNIIPIVSYSSQLIVNAETSHIEGVQQSGLFRQFLSPGITAGILGEFPIGSYLSIVSGGTFSWNTNGVFELIDDTLAFFYLQTINIPLLVKVRLWKTKWMPYAFIGVESSFIIYSAVKIDNDETLYTGGFDNNIRFGLNLGIGFSFDLGKSILDVNMAYNIGMNKDLSHEYMQDEEGNQEVLRNLFYITVGWRFIIGDRRMYMPVKENTRGDVLEVAPKFKLDKEFIEKHTFNDEISITAKITNYEKLYYITKNFILKVYDSYGNLVKEATYQPQFNELKISFTKDDNIRSFEEYSVVVTAQFTDVDEKDSISQKFKTGIIYDIHESGYKRISSTAVVFDDSGKLTEGSKENIKTIVDFIINNKITEENELSLYIGIERNKDDSEDIIKEKTKNLSKYIAQLGLYELIPDILIFSDTYRDDNIPGLVVFDFEYKDKESNEIESF